MNPATITIEHDAPGDKREATQVGCYSMSIWKKHPKEIIIHGTVALISHVNTWLDERRTKILYNSESLSPCPEGYKMVTAATSVRGVNIAVFRSEDPRCIWDETPSGVLRKLRELFTTPMLPEWGEALLTTLPTYILPLWGHNAAGKRIDNSLLPDVFDRHVQMLVKRKAIQVCDRM